MDFVQKLASDESDSDIPLGIAATFIVANFCTRPIIWANTTQINKIGLSIAIDTPTLRKKTMIFMSVK